MELIKEIEFTNKVDKMTKIESYEMVQNGTLKTMVEYMSKQKIPYLHARQVGIEQDFFVWQYKGAWRLAINPSVLTLKKDEIGRAHV